MLMESTYHSPKDKGFQLTPQEVENIRNWVQQTESQLIVNILKNWNLNGCGLIIWKVEHLDKPCSEWRKHPDIYILPDDGDKLIQTLANISLSNTILGLDKNDNTFIVYVGAAKNGDTNIDADVLDEFANAARRQGQ